MEFYFSKIVWLDFKKKSSRYFLTEIVWHIFNFTKYQILINIMHVLERIPGQRKEQVKQFLSEKLKINARGT